MKFNFYFAIFLLILLFSPIVLAQPNATTTSTTTTSVPSPPDLGIFKGIFNYLISANPVILLILGVILIVASKLAHWVGIVLIIFALIHLFIILIR